MKTSTIAIMLALTASASAALAEVQVTGYDDLQEGFLGTSFHLNGVQYSGVNGVGGVFPDGSTFTPADTGDQLIVENSQFLFDDFPAWGSPSNTLTFGSSYVNGPNLSLGAFSRVTMALDTVASAASVQMAFYENGPWGGIKFHLAAYRNGALVDSESFTIAGDGSGRDNIAFNSLAVAAGEIDTLEMYATFGDAYSAPRLIIDDLTITTVPSPAAILLALPLAALRRRR